MILSLYLTDTISSIFDYNVYNPGKNTIEIKFPYATDDKKIALNYANKYIRDGGVDENFIKIEKAIYKRVLEENDIPYQEMPEFMFQPIVIGLGKIFKNRQYKDWEGICYETKPHKSTLYLLSKLMNISTEEFKERYPILYSLFRE